MVLDPTLTLFPVANVAEYINRCKPHDAYINKSSTLTDTSKPEKFADKMKWIDWYPNLINFLRAIPRSNGVPFSYLCKSTNVQEKSVYNYSVDEHVDKAPLVGQTFATDAAGVHIYIVRFTSGNTVAEAKMVAYAAENNGRLDSIAFKDHYEVVRFYAVNLVQADKVLNNLFYSGEKKPHMWWDEFESQLTDEFNT